jgi:NADH dehydrogenase [ubiquinone] 1 alpha subcomplex assembly factor 7
MCAAHQLLSFLQAPGSADLTAWVDFSALRHAVSDRGVGVRMLGPISQGHFLLGNGIEQRVDVLLQVGHLFELRQHHCHRHCAASSL